MAEYAVPSDYPVKRPLLTGVLAEMVAQASAEEGRRPTAFPTLVRYSDAGRCARAIALSALLPDGQDEEIDVAGEFRMWIGSLLHEKVQEAILSVYGGHIEVGTFLGESSSHPVTPRALTAGHADWVGVIDGSEELGRILFELKTVGAFAFDQSIGLKRKSYSMGHPQGPKSSAKIQGALNAVANDCDTLVIGSISMEAVSLQLGEKVGLEGLDRIVAEWHYPRSEFEVWARDEMRRAERIDGWLAKGLLPPRTAVGDEFEPVELDPDSDRPKWQCVYCRCRTACSVLGPGSVPVERITNAQ